MVSPQSPRETLPHRGDSGVTCSLDNATSRVFARSPDTATESHVNFPP